MNFNFGSSTPKTTGGFTLSAPTPATTAPALSFSMASGDANSNKLTLTPASAAAGLSLQPKLVSSAAVSTAPGSTPAGSLAPTLTLSSTGATQQASLATTNVVSSTPSSTSASLNFCQLEEGINKWTLELEDQEKVFMNQATQVNAWDQLLIANGERLVSLNGSVERVKCEQQQLDHDLDFILAQQRELEECLVPLEKELGSTGLADPEREHTYQMAENIDTQLKQMSEDLKEIIEHLNETSQTQDNNDPVSNVRMGINLFHNRVRRAMNEKLKRTKIVQIGRILNAHMNSLQWIDQNTALIGTHLDQVTKLHDVHRRENERSFHLTYD